MTQMIPGKDFLITLSVTGFASYWWHMGAFKKTPSVGIIVRCKLSELLAHESIHLASPRPFKPLNLRHK